MRRLIRALGLGSAEFRLPRAAVVCENLQLVLRPTPTHSSSAQNDARLYGNVCASERM